MYQEHVTLMSFLYWIYPITRGSILSHMIGHVYQNGHTKLGSEWRTIESFIIQTPPRSVCWADININNGIVTVLGTDSLNDVSCAGKDTYIVEKISGRECEVKGFHDS